MDKLDFEPITFNEACRDLLQEFAYGMLASYLESRGLDSEGLIDFLFDFQDLDHSTLKKLLLTDPKDPTYGISQGMLDSLEANTVGEASNDNIGR